MAAKTKSEVLEIAGREVTITNPDKIFFPKTGYTKLDVVRYFASVSDAAIKAIANRPMQLVRYVNGAAEPPFYQKRAPDNRPEWIDTIELKFPSGRSAFEIVVNDAAQLAWINNLGCIELHPHPVRANDLEHPDELRIDLDPVPGVPWSQIRTVAAIVREVLQEHGLTGWPKTSGSRGMHVNVRIRPEWGFGDVRRAALAVAREVEKRAPDLATSAWWKEERQGVFLDYNQNAKDRTTAAAYSVRPTEDARVSTPLRWDEVDACEPSDFTIVTVPKRVKEIGNPAQEMDAAAGGLEALLALSERQTAEGFEDAPWPPHFAKQSGEPPRVQPSKRRTQKKPKRIRENLPLLTIARAARKEDALAALEAWKERHRSIAERLKPADFLVDSMRGRSMTWTRVRVNLKTIPEDERPVHEEPVDTLAPKP